MEKTTHNTGNAKTLRIHRPVVETSGGKSRITAKIDVDGESREVWFEVEEKYGQYLCFERSDAYVIGLLSWAMRERYDFVCDAPIGEELLYQLENYLIPSVVNASRTLYAPKIKADIDSTPLPNAGGVGTGISCGVDSLHVVANQWKSKFPNLRLTHLVLNNVGAFRPGMNQYSWQIAHAEAFCREYGFALVKTNSNFAEAFPQNHLLTHTYSSCFAIYMLQKLWGTYFYASSGYDFTEFRLLDNENEPPGHYELLSLPCFSTHSLRIHSEGGAKTRHEKVLQLVDFEPAQKYLHVCTNDGGENCNRCGKCCRTLVTLDALGALDKFKEVFDIEGYRKNRVWYLRWLAKQKLRPRGDTMVAPAFKILKKDISILIWGQAIVSAGFNFIVRRLAKILWLKKIYRKYIEKSA